MPYIVAQAIARYGAIVFPIAVCILIAAMGITYLALHLFLTKTDVVHYGATVGTYTFVLLFIYCVCTVFVLCLYCGVTVAIGYLCNYEFVFINC